jgi:hypothetical protein
MGYAFPRTPLMGRMKEWQLRNFVFVLNKETPFLNWKGSIDEDEGTYNLIL